MSNSSWIKVEDRLPDLNTDVLIVITTKTDKNDREVSVGHLSDEFLHNSTEKLIWNRCLIYEDKFIPEYHSHVTHWQPFPELPCIEEG